MGLAAATVLGGMSNMPLMNTGVVPQKEKPRSWWWLIFLHNEG